MITYAYHFFTVMLVCGSAPFSFAADPKIQGRPKQISPKQTIEKINIGLGVTKTFPVQSASVWVENGKIIKVKQKGSVLNVTGIKNGTSELRIGNKYFEIQVSPGRSNIGADLFHGLISKTVGLRANLNDGELQVRGRIFVFKDWMDVAKIADEKRIPYVLHAEVSPSVQQEAKLFFRKALEKAGLPTPSLVFGDFVELRLSTSKYRERFEKFFRPFGVRVTVDTHSLDVMPVIRVQISIAEIRRNQTQILGVNLPGSLRFQTQALDSASVDNLVFSANALEMRGIGRVLASPNILCRSGKEAQFLAGGEFPIKVSTINHSSVEWKRYGIMMKFKPQADSTGRMNLYLDTEVSSIDPSRSVDDIPALFTNHVSTYFDLSRPQTVALSGLIRNEESKNARGLPWLSRIPILGMLFSSQGFIDSKTELVIFVRPQIVNEDNISQANLSHIEELPENTTKGYKNEFE